jgi:hypothetical protein
MALDEEDLNDLLELGPTESRFDTELNSILREIRSDWGRSSEEIRSTVADIEQDHPVVEFIPPLIRWIEEEEYEDGAQLAIQELRSGVDTSLEEGWDGVSPLLISEQIKILSELNHEEELQESLGQSIDFLMEKEDSIPIGQVLDIIDLIIENICIIEGTTSVDVLLDYLNKHAERALEGNDFLNHRKLWRRNLEVRQHFDNIEGQPAKQEIIKSYSRQIQFLKDQNQQSQRATFAKEGIVECVDWISEDQRVRWEENYLEGNKESIEQMSEISHSPSDEEISDLEDAIVQIINGFEERKSNTNTVDSIIWLLNNNVVAPSVQRAQNISQGHISEIVSGHTITGSGESYSQDQARPDRPQSYGAMVQFTQQIRQSVYYRLNNRELVRESDFFLLFNGRDELTGDNIAYLSDFIINLFEHRYPEAVHIGMAQLESVIRKLMRKYGRSTLSVDSETGELYRKPLNGLLFELEDDLDEDWVEYMRYWYGDLSGQNLRNRIAHGYLPYRKANWGLAIILLFDILHTLLAFDEAFPQVDAEVPD